MVICWQMVVNPPAKKVCSIPDCGKTNMAARGWCWKHWKRWKDHGTPHYEPYRIPEWKKVGRTDFQRFFERVNVTEQCWLWTGAAVPHPGGGYEKFQYEGKPIYAYRWLYSQLVAPIPEGLTIDHLCRTPECVKPEHLEPVPLRVNILRGLKGQGAINARKTHCKHGHEFTPENTLLYKSAANGNLVRHCKRCIRIRTKLYAPAKREYDRLRHERKKLASAPARVAPTALRAR